MRLSDLFWSIVGFTFLIVVLIRDNIGTFASVLTMVQTATDTVQTAPNWFLEHWGIVMLAMVPIAWALKRRAMSQSSKVETEDGKAADFASYRYIEVKVIR